MIGLLRPRRLQLYILREFALVFAIALAACLILAVVLLAFMKVSDFQEFGITLGQAMMLAPFYLPKALGLSIPPAAMIAGTVVFGRLSAENEILAAQASGAPIRALAAPLLLCGVALSIFCLWCNQGGIRWGNATIRNEIFKIDKLEFFESLQKPGKSVTLPLEAGRVVRINWLPLERDEKSGAVRRPIHIAYFLNQEVGRMIVARDYSRSYGKSETGERILALTLKDAQVRDERAQPAHARPAGPDVGDLKSYFSECTWEIVLPQPGRFFNIGESRGEQGWLQNYSQARLIQKTFPAREKFMLQRAADFGAYAAAGSAGDPAAPAFCAESWNEARIASEAANGPTGARDRAQAEEAEAYRKIGLSVLPLSMVVLGIGLGLLVQKRQRLIGFLLALLVYALLFYPTAIISKELARAGMLGGWALFLPNLLLAGIGYGLWRAYERGWLAGASGWLGAAGERASDFFWTGLNAVRGYGVGLFRNKTDGYVAGSFLGPLVVVVLAVAFILTALDLVEHGPEVIEGITHREEAQPGIQARTGGQAVWDVATFYSIRALELLCELLPLLVLLAGVASVVALVRNNEHLIFKSSGVRLQRALGPMVWVTIVFSAAVAILRETALPELIMVRDSLRPKVYHRAPAPTAVAVHTLDDQGRPVLFQMSQYSSATREGKNLRVYQLVKDGRMPVIAADRARWNAGAWKLAMDPPPTRPASGKEAPAPPPAPLDHGYLISPQSEESSGGQSGDDIRLVSTVKTAVKEWRGAITPAFLECERLGAGVMSIGDLAAASKVKPELGVEFWRRVCEVVMGVALLWIAIPLLVSETRSAVAGVALSILCAAAFWGLNMACVEAARNGVLPVFMPLLTALAFCSLGFVQYYRRMAT